MQSVVNKRSELRFVDYWYIMVVILLMIGRMCILWIKKSWIYQFLQEHLRKMSNTILTSSYWEEAQ